MLVKRLVVYLVTEVSSKLPFLNPYGEGMQLSSQREVIALQSDEETPEMQHAIQQALAGETISSQPYYDPNLEYNTVSYVTPVYTNGEISGVLACSVSTEAYADILSSISSVSDVGAVAVLNGDGDVLASTRTYICQNFTQNLNHSCRNAPQLSDLLVAHSNIEILGL